MHRHLHAVPRPQASRPAKVISLEARRQLRREREQHQLQPRPRPRPAA